MSESSLKMTNFANLLYENFETGILIKGPDSTFFGIGINLGGIVAVEGISLFRRKDIRGVIQIY